MPYTVKRHIFKDGKVMYEDIIAYANGEYVSLDDFEIAMQKKKDEIVDLRKDLRESGACITQLKHELSDVQKSTDEYYNKCIDLTNQIEKLKSKLKTKDNIQKINLNETIKVKLTPLGAEIYYKQFDELNKQYGKEICKPQMPHIDKDGYTEFQLWHFIELYGQYIGMCKPNVIEPLDILHCGNNKYHSDHAE